MSSTPSPEASTTPSPTESSAPAPTGAEALLLNAEEMPGLNEVTVWTEESTEEQGLEADGSTAVGVCQKTPLHDIGATKAVKRTFTTEGGSATQVVATLADAKSVMQTSEVLRSWHKRCADQIEAAAKDVGPLEKIKVPAGTAEAYVVHYGAQGAELHTWESVAINTSGNFISLTVIANETQDYNYAETPAVQAAKAVAAKVS